MAATTGAEGTAPGGCTAVTPPMAVGWMRLPGLRAAAADRLGKSEASNERGEATSGGASRRRAVDCLMVTGRDTPLLTTSPGMAGGGRSEARGGCGTGGGGWAAPAQCPPCAAALASSHAPSTASASSLMWKASAEANARRDRAPSWGGTPVCAQSKQQRVRQVRNRHSVAVRLLAAHLGGGMQPGKHRVRLQAALESLFQHSLDTAAVSVVCRRIRHGC